MRSAKLDAIINIVDSTNLSRSLFFTTQLLELGVPVVVALNKTDINKKKENNIDAKSKYTANDGSQRTVYEVVVDNAFFCESKGGNAGGAPSYDSQIPQYSEAKPAFSTAHSGDFEEILTDEDLPF